MAGVSKDKKTGDDKHHLIESYYWRNADFTLSYDQNCNTNAYKKGQKKPI